MRRREFLERAGLLGALAAFPGGREWAKGSQRERPPVPFVDGLCFMPSDLADVARSGHVVVPELNDIQRMFSIHQALEKAGFKSEEREKIMGGNWIRVLTESLG